MMLQRQREYTINSVTFIQALYTLQRGDGHLAKRLILRLPETKLEKEKEHLHIQWKVDKRCASTNRNNRT